MRFSIFLFVVALSASSNATPARAESWVKKELQERWGELKKWQQARKEAAQKRRKKKIEKEWNEHADKAAAQPALSRLRTLQTEDGRIDRSKITLPELSELISNALDEARQNSPGGKKSSLYIWDWTEFVQRVTDHAGLKDPYVTCELGRRAYSYQVGRKFVCDLEKGEQQNCVYREHVEDSDRPNTPRCWEYDDLGWESYAKLMKDGRLKFFHLKNPNLDEDGPSAPREEEDSPSGSAADPR